MDPCEPHAYPNEGDLAHRGVVTANDLVAPDCWRLEIRAPEIAAKAKPGRFVMLRCRQADDPFLSRAFSICDVVREAGEPVGIVVLQLVIGVGTQALAERAVGEPIGLLGPLGHPYGLGTPDEHMVMVAGGVGAAPFLLTARALRERSPDQRLTYLVGGRNADYVYLADAIRNVGCDVQIATDDGSLGHKGYVTDLLKPLLEPGVRVIACGPNPMFKSLAQLVETARGDGLDFPCEVSTEESMPCGYGACAGCVVPLRSDRHAEGYRYGKSCVEGPVFPDRGDPMGPDSIHPLDGVFAELSRVAASVDPDEMDALVELMARAKRIFVAGMGRSGLMAQAFAMRLMHLEMDVFVVGETTTPAIGRGDLLICCSRYGRSRSLRGYIEKAHEHRAMAAVITMSPDTPLATQADHVFTIPVEDGGKSQQPMGTIFEQSLLMYCDALTLLAMKKLDISESQMRKRHTQLE